MKSLGRILVLGSTGYVGSRLVPLLLKEGYVVRAGYRSREKIECMKWYQHERLEPVQIDVLKKESLIEGCRGCDTAYYLIHSMYKGKRFAEIDLRGAKNMVQASEQVGVKHIIYLGGLGEDEQNLSEHLSSRAEVSRVLHKGSVPVTTLRAAMIIGAGSTSFEILRYLVERLPIMTTPKWLRTNSQPIAISNVLNYLIGCLKHAETRGRVFDIGGSEILSYTDLIKIYIEITALPRRLIVPIPFLTPSLSSYWLALITPVPSAIVRPLIGGLKNEAICLNNEIKKISPQKLLTNRQAMKLALNQIEHWFKKTHSEDVSNETIPEWKHNCDPWWAGGDINVIRQTTTINATSEMVWNSICSVIGSEGWNYGSWLWIIRGRLDELIGGKGMRYGAAKLHEAGIESIIDSWSIVDIIEGKYLKLRLKMHVPAKISLEFILSHGQTESTELTLRLSYYPKGFRGFLIWYGFLPLRRYLIRQMVSHIEKESKILLRDTLNSP